MSSPLKCAQCHEKIVNDGRHMSCAECRASYHLGKLCSGVAENTFNAMAVGKREVWRCRVCRQRHSGNESRSEASSSQCASPAGTEHLRSLEAKLECLTLLKANVDTLLDLPTQMNQLLTLKPVVESLKSAVTEVQKAVDFLSARYDSLLSTATTNSAAITELREETTLLRSVVTEQSQTIEHLKEELNDSDLYSRLSNLEIHGLPHAPSENLVSVVGELAGKLGLENFQPRDILAAHRLPSRRDGPPVILVKLASVSLREQWLATRGKLRTLAAEGSLPKLFLNGNLTRKNRELFWMVREKARSKQYQFTWVKNGKLFAKKSGTSSLVRIHWLADLELIV
ncbi:uncharacterized protein ISCGN_006357 [Ixodes scapularis]